MNEIVDEIKNNEKVINVKYLGVNNFNDSNIDYLLVIESPIDLKLQIRRDALHSILEVLEKNNIEIPYNQLDIHNK